MNIVEAYSRVYTALKKYYEQTDLRYDGLVLLLTDMDVGTQKLDTSESIPSNDPAFGSDWKRAWEKTIGKGQDGTAEQVFRVAKIILDYYSKTVNVDIGNAEEYLLVELAIGKPTEILL
jgi:hypothetical protein